jgi:hypothetical protein
VPAGGIGGIGHFDVVAAWRGGGYDRQLRNNRPPVRSVRTSPA